MRRTRTVQITYQYDPEVETIDWWSALSGGYCGPGRSVILNVTHVDNPPNYDTVPPDVEADEHDGRAEWQLDMEGT
jgi:hypothetical protein